MKKLHRDSRIVVCLPAYNESRNISNIVKMARNYSTEVLVCDDGSIDGTYEIARAAGAIVIKHETNKGYGAAIRTLFETAKGRGADIVVTIDSDGQHNVDQIPDLLHPILNNEADIVIGSRFLNRDDSGIVPLYRTIGIKALTKFAGLVSYNDLTDGQSGFRAYNRKALSRIRLSEKGMAVSAEILVKAKDSNLRVKEVPVTITYDVEGGSTHNPLSHGLGVMIAIVKFISIKHPLAFYGILGFAFLAVAAIFAINAISFVIDGKSPSTNIVVLTIGSALMGLTLIATGAILYSLARISVIRDNIDS